MSASQTGPAAADLYEQLAARLLAQPHVEQGTGFGRVPGLRTGKKIFAMLCRDELVVKLPRERVDSSWPRAWPCASNHGATGA